MPIPFPNSPGDVIPAIEKKFRTWFGDKVVDEFKSAILQAHARAQAQTQTQHAQHAQQFQEEVKRRTTQMYTPPATNAQSVNPFNGNLSPITSSTALILFSSPEDDEAMLPILKQLDPNVSTFDGQGVVCPEIAYGDDGRKILGVQGTVNGLAYQSTVGILIAQKNWGSAWNAGRQQPYTSLFCDKIAEEQGQLNWGH